VVPIRPHKRRPQQNERRLSNARMFPVRSSTDGDRSHVSDELDGVLLGQAAENCQKIMQQRRILGGKKNLQK
jgi:hypothetical protein